MCEGRSAVLGAHIVSETSRLQQISLPGIFAACQEKSQVTEELLHRFRSFEVPHFPLPYSQLARNSGTRCSEALPMHRS